MTPCQTTNLFSTAFLNPKNEMERVKMRERKRFEKIEPTPKSVW